MTTVADVGDAIELIFTTVPSATVTLDWISPDQVTVFDDQAVSENPVGTGQYPVTFTLDSPGVWTAEFRATGTTTVVERYYVRATTLSGPPPFAAVGDVAAQFGTMSAAEQSLAGWLLRAASNMIRSRRPTIDQQIRDGFVSQDMAALAVTNMVLRVMRNPGGLRSETVGPFSRSYDTSVAAGLLVITDNEWALLEPAGASAPSTRVGSITPKAALAIAPINRTGGWPDGWW